MAKLTANQYLNDDIESIIDHLNKSPIPSEMPFVSAVLTARATISYEKLTKKIVFLTRIMAIATAFLVIVPFATKFFENIQIDKINKYQEERIKSLESQIIKMNLNTTIISEILEKIEGKKIESKKTYENLRIQLENLEENQNKKQKIIQKYNNDQQIK